MNTDAEIMVDLIRWAGFSVDREATTNRTGVTTYRVMTRDDNADLQVVDAEDELSALVELAKRLGFEDMD